MLHYPGEPFYVGVNTSDPHRPFAGSLQEKEHVLKLRKKYPQILDYPKVEPICSETEVPLLPYLPDLPDIRKEMVQYLTCVKRADNTLGKIIQLLDEEGLYANTIFIFFSDHGAPMPSAKQNVYAHSARTDPLIKRRLDEILLRSKEELFDRRKDPFALNNVVENPEAYGALNKLKNLVAAEMRRSRDPLLEYFEGSEGYPEEWDN